MDARPGLTTQGNATATEKHQRCDPAMVHSLRAADRHRRAGRSHTVLLVVGLVVALLPGLAAADFGAPGLNGAQLDVDTDNLFPSPQPRQIMGRNFTPRSVAQIFMCPLGAMDLQTECQRTGAIPTDTSGAFSTSAAVPFGVVSSDFVTPDGTKVTCRSVGATQCAVAAATYDGTGAPTAQAERQLCFYAQAQFARPVVAKCSPIVTTTTTPPPEPEWEPTAPMNVARQYHATAVGTDGRIYALGGIEADGDAIGSAETLDPCGDKTWALLPPMPTPRAELAAAAGPDGRIYAIGGREADGTPLATVEAYDPVSNTWSTVARLPVPRSDLAAATGADGRIYAIGGNVGGLGNSATVEAYDIATDTWTPAAPVAAPRSGPSATTGVDGLIYLVSRTNPYVQTYRPGPAGTPGTWQPGLATASPDVQPGFTGASTPDGLIYLIGGYDAFDGALRIVKAYNPLTDTWTAFREALTTPRGRHGGAPGRDGRVYAIGGTDFVTDDNNVEDGPQPLASVESLKVGPNTCPRLTPPADFDGDADTDVSVFRPSTGSWLVKDGTTSSWGAQGDIPVPGDYDGDAKVDVAIFRPDTGLWAIDGSAGADTFVTYGIATDVPVPADYDGDRKTDIAVYRPEYATWWVHRSSDGTDTATTFGLSTDVPVPGDYDGDAKADLGIFRDGAWFVLPASGGSYTATTYGIGGDIPVPGDYDGDHTTDMAVFRPSEGTWFLHHSSDGADEVFGFGSSGDVPVTGDYNADRIADPAVFRPSTGEWFIETGQSASWGVGSDLPLPLPYAVRRAYFPNSP